MIDARLLAGDGEPRVHKASRGVGLSQELPERDLRPSHRLMHPRSGVPQCIRSRAASRAASGRPSFAPPPRSVVNAFDDAHVAHYRRIAESSERGLIAGALVSGDRLSDTIEFDQYDRQIDARLINLGGAAVALPASIGFGASWPVLPENSIRPESRGETEISA